MPCVWTSLLKEVTPSAGLRRWFGHDPAKWRGFVRRSRAELRQDDAAAALSALTRRACRKTVTLIYAARDGEHNSAIVLREMMEESPTARRSQTRLPRGTHDENTPLP